MLPDASASRASKQQHAAIRFISDKQHKSLDPFRWDTEILLYGRVVYENIKCSVVVQAENSRDNEA